MRNSGASREANRSTANVESLAAELDEGVVVCVLADGGWKYLSADFWDAGDVEHSMERTVWW